MGLAIEVDEERIASFCRRWKIDEFSVFGSALREDFGPDSDLDVLVAFAPDAPWTAFEWVDMRDELEAMFGRQVDLVEKGTVRNPFRHHEIEATREIVYAV